MKESASIHEMPYDAGNAADLLKHSWLAVVVQWLLARSAGTHIYADPFAGEWEYEACPLVRARLKRFVDGPLPLYSRSAWDAGRYLGSTGLVGSIRDQLRRPIEIWVGDRCRSRVTRLVEQHGCHELPYAADGYVVLTDTRRYDLILLDPLADFLPEAPRLLPRIVARSAASSILLLVLTESRASDDYRTFADALWMQCSEHGATALLGGVPAVPGSEIRGEGRYAAEMVFIPERATDAAEVLPELAAAAVHVAALLGHEAEAHLRLLHPLRRSDS